MAGLPKKVLSFYEIGRRKVPSEYLVPIADVLGISVDELVGREYDENDSAARTTVGQRIRWLREYVGLSVNDFAVSLGVANSTIYRLEELEHSLSRNAVKTICRVYGVNEEWLQYQRGEMFADDALIKEEKERHNTYDYTGIGSRLRTVRNKRHIKQSDLAEALNCSTELVRSIELNRRKPTESWLRDVSEILNVSFVYLMTGEGEPFGKDDYTDAGILTYPEMKEYKKVIHYLRRTGIADKTMKRIVERSTKEDAAWDQWRWTVINTLIENKTNHNFLLFFAAMPLYYAWLG